MKNLILLFIILSACSRDNDRELLFIGDSHVAYWDVNHYFVQTVNNNKGKIGNKLGDINIFDLDQGNIDKVIIVAGFNDMHELFLKTKTSEELIDSVIFRYNPFFQRINNYSNIYMVSLFPIGKNYEDQQFVFKCADIIKTINTKLENLLEDYPNIHFLKTYSELADDEGYLKKNYTNDGLHLNKEGYNILTNITLKYVQ